MNAPRGRSLVCLAAWLTAMAGAARGEEPTEGWKLTPYGILFFNGFTNTAATNNADVPLWASAGPGSTSASARQSRFGLKLAGLSVGSAKVSGVAEADFFGGFPAIGIGDSMGVVRLRLAHARLDWDATTLVVGQDWVVFAPANPVSLAAASIPLMAASGNPWARLPQVRLERRAGALTLKGAVLAPSTGDFASAFLYQPASGALSEWPFFEARAAVATKNALGTGAPATLGISGHYGRAKVLGTAGAPDALLESTGIAADVAVPLGRRVTVTGEAFAGRNLAGFQAAIFQGTNPDFVTGGTASVPRSIATAGGWAQIAVVAVPKRLSVYGTYGVDRPKERDLASAAKRDWRLANDGAAVGVVNTLSAQLSWGVEVRHEKTRFLLSGTKENTHVNVASTLAF